MLTQKIEMQSYPIIYVKDMPLPDDYLADYGGYRDFMNFTGHLKNNVPVPNTTAILKYKTRSGKGRPNFIDIGCMNNLF